jgi:hypothetical protein
MSADVREDKRPAVIDRRYSATFLQLVAVGLGRERGGDTRNDVGTDHDHWAILIGTAWRCKIAATILAKAVSRYG